MQKSIVISHYLVCAAWAENADGYEFSDQARKTAAADVDQFLKQAGNAVDGIPEPDLGHDIWLTRNRHGAGFFDRSYNPEIEQRLTEAAQSLGTRDLYLNESGTLDFS